MVIIKCKKCSDGFHSGYLYNALDYLHDKEKQLHLENFNLIMEVANGLQLW